MKKMKVSDIGVVAVMYIICGYFYAMTLKLKKDSQTYPKFTIALLFFLTTIYLVNMLISAKRYGVTKKDDSFEGFMPVQFIAVAGASVLYLVLINFLGFFTATVFFLFGVMKFLKVSYLKIAITEVSVNLIIYLAFVLFLGVHLPRGILI